MTADRVPQSFWFSSATAGLVASLQAFDVAGKWVAVPPNVCPNVLAAVVAAGGQPWFVDIDATTQGVNPDRLAEILADVAAVIAVHAYGTPCRIEEIAALCRKAAVPLIEDCAQADGASVGSREVGSFGDLAVFSFGAGKIVEAGGGGLVLANDAAAERALAERAQAWDAAPGSSAGEDLSGVYRYFYNHFYPARTDLIQESFHALLQTLAPQFAGRCDAQRVPVLQAARANRTALVEARRRRHQRYAEGLAEIGVDFLPLQDGAAPWRFNALLAPGCRDRVFRQLLKTGLKASTWYPRMNSFLPAHAYRATALPVAAEYERKLLNLWVDDATTDDDIARGCRLLEQALAKSRI